MRFHTLFFTFMLFSASTGFGYHQAETYHADSSSYGGSRPPLYSLPPTACRDFLTITDIQLPICDYITTDRLKTDLISLLIQEQKKIDLLIQAPETEESYRTRLRIIKSHLAYIEQFAVSKIGEICALKGYIIKEGSNLVSGCTYNAYYKIKSLLILVRNKNFTAKAPFEPAIDEQTKFDTLMNDILLDLAEKNKNSPQNSEQIKGLMMEILKLYGTNGQSLYSAIWGMCGLETISETPDGDEVDASQVQLCEGKYLNDLRQVLL